MKGKSQRTGARAAEIQAEALHNAKYGQSFSNYPAIILGFTAKGIPEAEILPRENVFTYNAWRALGRQVRKGEKGVRVATIIRTAKEIEKDGQTEVVNSSRPWSTTVFHISQTEPISN